MTDRINASVEVTIAGQSHQIRWDKAALFELGAFPDALADIDVNNGAALWRRACIYLFCMIVGNNPFKSPREIAAAVSDDETEALMNSVNEAIIIASGEKDSADDPLKSGLLQDADSG